MNGLRVAPLARREVDWMVREHYLHRWPGVVVATLGLFHDDLPVGVLVFALPPASTYKRYGGLTWELARLWVRDEEPKNTESWFIAEAIRWVKREHPEVWALVSYADPSAGHSGVIYRATNWLGDGMTDDERKTPRHDYYAGGRHYSRRGHVPDGLPVTRVPRVSKHRFVMGLSKRARRALSEGRRTR